jgi:enoyl-CoA hydratase
MDAPASRELVRLERRGPVGIVWIDHPPVNVLSAAVLRELMDRFAEVSSAPDLRAVILAGAAEKAFAAGADIREMAPMGPPEAHVHGARGQAVTRAIERLPLPVIAAVHGVCLGGGCEIAMACDFIIASEDAVFGQPEVNLGVMPGWGGTQRLPRRIRPPDARAWILTGRSIPAKEAYEAGLVYRLVARSELLPFSIHFAGELAQKSPLALAAAKYAMNRAIDPELDGRLSFELALWEKLFGTRDQKAGMEAFTSKQPWVPAGREGWAEASRAFPWGASRTSGRSRRKKSAGASRAKRP